MVMSHGERPVIRKAHKYPNTTIMYIVLLTTILRPIHKQDYSAKFAPTPFHIFSYES